MEEEAVITAKDVASIYEVPVVFAREGVDTLILKYLHLEAKERDLKSWEEIVHKVYNPKAEVTIGIVGKYVEYEDSYKSLKEALVHGALGPQFEVTGQLDRSRGVGIWRSRLRRAIAKLRRLAGSGGVWKAWD